MGKVSLTELYEKYTTAKNSVEKSGYGTLYRMAGGKKEIPEYGLDMMCYISALDRLRRADRKYSELLMQDREKAKQREEQITFYLPRYKSALEYIAYVYGMELSESRIELVYRYSFRLDGSLVLIGGLSLDAEDFYLELYQGLKKINVQLAKASGRYIYQMYEKDLSCFEKEVIPLLQKINSTLGTGVQDKKEVK